MNFFEHQEQARKRTRYILGLFLIAIATSILLVYATIVPGLYILWHQTIPLFAIVGMGPDENTFDPQIFWTFWVWWTPQTLIIVSLVTLFMLGAGYFYKQQIIRTGGKTVAEALGGQRVQPESRDRQSRKLQNVVEEIALAAGIPIPEVYVLHSEAEINAFAAGFTVNNAVIGVTQGCLNHLTREELQGVVGHEMSHIMNGDMRLNTQLISGLYGFFLMYIAGWRLLRSKQTFMGIGMGLTVIGRLNLLLGRLIQSALSRQREFLADASAVQFTREPQGLANALIKIAHQGSQIQTPEVESASHLFFGNVRRSKFASWWTTHPPIETRLKKLGVKHPAIKSYQQTGSMGTVKNVLTLVGIANQENALMPNAGEQTNRQNLILQPSQVSNAVGRVDPQHLTYTQALLKQLPPEIRQALKYREDAIPVIYGLLLDHREPIQARQLEFLRATESEDRAQVSLCMYEQMISLDQKIRLPIIDLAIPALRQSSGVQFQTLLEQVDALINCDGQCSITEYSLRMILKQRLKNYFELSPQINRRVRVDSLWLNCVVLLSALAHVGHSCPESRLQALVSGLQRLPQRWSQTLPTTMPDFTLTSLEHAIEHLSQSVPRLRQIIVDSCAHTVLVDSVVTLPEADLLRAIVVALNCPLPPLLNVTSA